MRLCDEEMHAMLKMNIFIIHDYFFQDSEALEALCGEESDDSDFQVSFILVSQLYLYQPDMNI